MKGLGGKAKTPQNVDNRTAVIVQEVLIFNYN